MSTVKKKDLLWPITTDAKAATNQSKLKGILHVTGSKRGKKRTSNLPVSYWLREWRELAPTNQKVKSVKQN